MLAAWSWAEVDGLPGEQGARPALRARSRKVLDWRARVSIARRGSWLSAQIRPAAGWDLRGLAYALD